MRSKRSESGLSRRAAASRADLEGRRLKALELGHVRATDVELESLAAAYGVPVDELLPPRRAVEFDPERATLVVGDEVRKVGDAGAGTYAVLKEYLDVVYELRNTSRLERIPLRDDDLDALAGTLGREPRLIEERLVELMDVTHEEAVAMRRVILRRRIAVPAAGLVMSAGLVAGLEVGTSGSDDVEAVVERSETRTTEPVAHASDPEPEAATTPPADAAGEDEAAPAPDSAETTPPSGGDELDDVEIGDAIYIERGDSEPTVRGSSAPPPAALPAPAEDPGANASTGDELDDVEIGDAIYIERGDAEPTIRE